MMRLATKAGSAAPSAVRRPAASDGRGGLPPRVIRQVATHQRQQTSLGREDPR